MAVFLYIYTHIYSKCSDRAQALILIPTRHHPPLTPPTTPYLLPQSHRSPDPRLMQIARATGDCDWLTETRAAGNPGAMGKKRQKKKKKKDASISRHVWSRCGSIVLKQRISPR